MTKKIEDTARNQIAGALPFAIGKALGSYRYFLENSVKWQEISKFKDAHAACKTAIAHVELLIKLAQWADKPSETDEQDKEHQDLLTKIEKAKEELATKEKGDK